MMALRPSRMLLLGAALLLITVVVSRLLMTPPALPSQPVPSVAAAQLLIQPVADTVPNAAQIRRGQHLVILGDCMSCHLRAGGEPFAGGLGLNTPFGVIYSSNISSDKETGIGDWSPEQFYRAMHDGKGPHGNLYPAFPYPYFNRVSRSDDDAILAYLKTTPAVRYQAPTNQLPFPMNIRAAVAGWNLLFLKAPAPIAAAGQSEDWRLGAEIVNGLGHCAACHSPKNSLGADLAGKAFHGGELEGNVAPDLTSNPRTGLGAWSIDDIAQYLAAGRNRKAAAGGVMGDVVTYSTALMTDRERRAIAVYLKSLPARADTPIAAADPGQMRRGGAIYSDVCSACHLEKGVGQPGYFPPLGKNAVAQQDNPTGLVKILLAGSRTGPSPSRPSPLTMPGFAWKLGDSEVADVLTYVRNSWGNRASPVSAAEVGAIRKKLNLTPKLHPH